MKASYRFKNLIKKYSTYFKVIEKGKGSYDTKTGKYIEGADNEVPMKGCVVPYAESVVYQSGGTILQSDRQIICLREIDQKATIIYKNKKYKVLQETPYDEYGDFYIYQARRVDCFD